MLPAGKVRLRSVDERDIDFLKAMLLETINWNEDRPRRALEEVLSEPGLAKYIQRWGRRGDSGILALSESNERLGAAWYRLFGDDDRGYGFVSPEVPELGLATVVGYRGRGLGRTLMQRLIQVAASEGHPALSLSVEEDNRRAVAMYESLGFKRVGRVEQAWTMVLTLNPNRTVISSDNPDPI
jgi:ribosomal protein S18 acetylase RimI-like enzyme